MIQLATDPNASRPNWRPAPAEGKENAAMSVRRPRSGHAWPFIAQYVERPAAARDSKRAPNGESGS